MSSILEVCRVQPQFQEALLRVLLSVLSGFVAAGIGLGQVLPYSGNIKPYR